MTGTPLRCAASTMEAAIWPLCGATMSTSRPLVNMLSACLVGSASPPLATCTSSCALTPLARCWTRALSRCQRSSFSVSMEKPIRTGPLCGAWAVPVAVVPSGAFTQEAASSIPATPSAKRDTFIILSLPIVVSLYHNPRRTRLSMGKPGRLATASVFLVISCASATTSSDPLPSHRRAVGPSPAVVQWNHQWARGAVCYEIFIRSFEDADGDGIGDLKGLPAKLDSLNDGDPATTTDLGIDAIWLTPIFESPSYHGYDTVDYEAIEKDYGTMTDFRRFEVDGVEAVIAGRLEDGRENRKSTRLNSSHQIISYAV